MNKHTIFIEKDIPLETEKRIKRNLRKINNAIIDISGMGYDLYLSPNTLNVCDGDTHPDDHHPDRSVVVASIIVFGIDGGDW